LNIFFRRNWVYPVEFAEDEDESEGEFSTGISKSQRGNLSTFVFCFESAEKRIFCFAEFIKI
jgi:hypothetical protein